MQYTTEDCPTQKQLEEDITETMMETINLLSPESFSVIDFKNDSIIAGLRLSNGYIKRMKKKGLIVDPGFPYVTAPAPFKGKLKLFDTRGSSIWGSDFSVYELGELANANRSAFLNHVERQEGVDTMEDGFHVAQVNSETGREPCLITFGTGKPSRQRMESFERTITNHTCGSMILDYENSIGQGALKEVEGCFEFDLSKLLEIFREEDPEVTDTQLMSLPFISAVVKHTYSLKTKGIELEEPDGMVQCKVIEDDGNWTAVCIPVSQG